MNKYIIEEEKKLKNYYLIYADSPEEAIDRLKNLARAEHKLKSVKKEMKGISDLLAGVVRENLGEAFPGEMQKIIDNEAFKLYNNDNKRIYESARRAENDGIIRKTIKDEIDRLLFLSD